ncbi:MAG: XRE family transcriptional regulator [Cyanobacteria bacterium P01_A01_bin.116]
MALSYYLDIQSLASLVRSKRGARGLRATAQECGTSASTLSRVEREQVPDISSFLLLCDWLEISPARLFKDSAMEEQQGEGELPLSKADELALRVRADSRLEPATANVLAVLIKAAYKISSEIRD